MSDYIVRLEVTIPVYDVEDVDEAEWLAIKKLYPDMDVDIETLEIESR